MAEEARSGFYRLYYYEAGDGRRLGDLISTNLGGYYDPNKDGTPSEQVVKWIRGDKKDFHLKPGTYFVIHEDYTNGSMKTSFYVKEEEIVF